MSTALFAFERPEQAQRAAETLRRNSVAGADLTLHLPHIAPGDRTAAAVDEQVTGGVLTNVTGLFGEVFEWGAIPIDTSAYAATVRRGGAVVSVHAASPQARSSIDALMTEAHPATSSGWFDYPGEAPADSAP